MWAERPQRGSENLALQRILLTHAAFVFRHWVLIWSTNNYPLQSFVIVSHDGSRHDTIHRFLWMLANWTLVVPHRLHLLTVPVWTYFMWCSTFSSICKRPYDRFRCLILLSIFDDCINLSYRRKRCPIWVEGCDPKQFSRCLSSGLITLAPSTRRPWRERKGASHWLMSRLRG